MTASPGSRIGPYEISREIGRGGMGVVFLGRDPRLDRDVALKVLPEHLAQDPERLLRFEREAKTLAQLNHSNVAGIHGVEDHAGARYLVLEYVEGETLADRLERGALPVDEALEIAVQIAAGLEAAPEAGVIHRDLKPGNVIVTPDGSAKVLDFGLARVEEASPASERTTSPTALTRTLPAALDSPTVAGVILGTAAYMSPEQARGRKVDKRTDIWSFGVVLYEMLTGVSPFAGETVSDTLGAVLRQAVDLDRLPADTPLPVRRVLLRCLERDRTQRLRDIGDARLELQAAPLHRDEDASLVSRRLPRRSLVSDGRRIVFRGRTEEHFVPSLMMLSVSGDEAPVRVGNGTLMEQVPSDWSRDGTKILFDEPQRDTQRDILVYHVEDGRTETVVASTGMDTGGRFSPTGDWIAYESDASGDEEIYLRDLEGTGARLQVSVGGGKKPRWAPDGSAIYYLVERPTSLGRSGTLMRVAVDLTVAPPALSAPEPALELPANVWNGEYDLDPSGERILVLTVAESEDARSRTRIHFALNWFEELERILSGDGGSQ